MSKKPRIKSIQEAFLQMMVLLETEEKVQARWSVATSQLTSSGVRQVGSQNLVSFIGSTFMILAQ